MPSFTHSYEAANKEKSGVWFLLNSFHVHPNHGCVLKHTMKPFQTQIIASSNVATSRPGPHHSPLTSQIKASQMKRLFLPSMLILKKGFAVDKRVCIDAGAATKG